MAAFLATLTLTWAAMEVIAYRVVGGEVREQRFETGRNKYEAGSYMQSRKRSEIGWGTVDLWGHSTEYRKGWINARTRTPMVQ